MADIFISYSSKDRMLAKSLASDLEEKGFSVWWDINLTGGRDFEAEIRKELEKAHAVIVIWTKNSVRSEFVRDEVKLAKQAAKLVPTRARDLSDASIPLGHGQTETIFLDERQRIYSALAFHMRKGAQDAPSLLQPKFTASRRLPWAVGVLVIALVVAAAYFVRPQKNICTAADWELIRNTQRILTLRAFAADCQGDRYGDLAEEEVARRDAVVSAEIQAKTENEERKRRAEEVSRKAEEDAKAKANRQQEAAELALRDNTAFAEAKAQNNIAAYNAYLAAWQRGQWVSQAREAIANIDAAEQHRKFEEQLRLKESLRRPALATVPGTREPLNDEPVASPKIEPKYNISGCIILSSALNAFVPIRISSRICDEENAGEAVVIEIRDKGVRFKLGTNSVTCPVNAESCAFPWPNGNQVLFRVSVTGAGASISRLR